MNIRPVRPVAGPLDVELDAPPSKSATHRALVAAALSRGRSTLRHPLIADDTRCTREGLTRLGISIEIDSEGDEEAWGVRGGGGVVPGGGVLDLGQSGTSFRFLTAVAALGRRASTLDGEARLRERPIAPLIAALEALGASMELPASGASLPLVARPGRLAGGAITLPPVPSSQFASALLLIAPGLPRGVDLTLEPPAVSLPYVELTEAVLRDFGAGVTRPDPLRWIVHPGLLEGRDYVIEGDHSSASYLLAAAAIVGGRVSVRGLRPQSAQPDSRLASILEKAGCQVTRHADGVEVLGSGSLAPFDLDLGEAPDLVPTLGALALFADGTSTMRGIAHLRVKESDRLEVVASNLRTLGARVEIRDAGLIVEPPRRGPGGGLVRTASDHRIAMAFAVAGLRVPGVSIDDPDCVAKSHPRFWEQLDTLAGPGDT